MSTNLELLKPKAKRMTVEAFKSLAYSTSVGVHVDKIILSNGELLEFVPSFKIVRWNAGKNTPRLKHILREVNILSVAETNKKVYDDQLLINSILDEVSKLSVDSSTGEKVDKITFLLLNLKRSLNEQ